jgi:hypothetical protein
MWMCISASYSSGELWVVEEPGSLNSTDSNFTYYITNTSEIHRFLVFESPIDGLFSGD